MINLGQYSDRDKTYSIFICSRCGKPIVDAKKAIITFQDLIGNPVNKATGIFHKAQCDPGDKIAPYSDDLDNFLAQLIHILKVN